MFGTILHAAVQRLYAPIEGEAHPGGTLRALIRTGEVAAAVEAAIGEHYLKDPKATAADYTGNLVLVKDIVVRYLRGGVMPYDAAHDGFRVEGLERRVDYGFDFATAGGPRRMKFSGIADRIDRLTTGRCAWWTTRPVRRIWSSPVSEAFSAARADSACRISSRRCSTP